MELVTLCYILQEGMGDIPKVCLALKKNRHAAGWLNAAGGHVRGNETTAEAAARELWEEQAVRADPDRLRKIAEIRFSFPRCPTRESLRCLVYYAPHWHGEPQETDEMGPPQWFRIDRLPFRRLPPADRYWLAEALQSKMPIGGFGLAPDDSVLSYDIVFRAFRVV